MATVNEHEELGETSERQPAQRWLGNWPNLRLAIIGFVLILLQGGLFSALERGLKAYREYMLDNVPREQWDVYLYWHNAVAYSFAAICFPMMFTGMTMLPFAAYRAIRDFVARRRTR